jgi:hypothetical protein
MKESVIASDLTIEGKIIGSGHVRIAGRFKGDVQVDGNVTLDSGAHLEGQVKAQVVVVGGELLGNIDNAKRVELLEGGVISGDVKAGSQANPGAGRQMTRQFRTPLGHLDAKTRMTQKTFPGTPPVDQYSIVPTGAADALPCPWPADTHI